MRRVVVGTAGHIDHGKTRLVLALTGIDCDRLAEEKRRGITIDLGFAHLLEGDLQLGFVDVPGHERFLHNALAGLGGIRVVLLVVAADEGVKPQTREHLAICSLLAIPAAIVALTKLDLVEPELAELAALEVAELLAGTPFAGAEIVPVSATTGEGIAALRAKLLELAGRHAVPEEHNRPARLPVDRAFLLKGLGLVATGTLAAGAIAPGDELEVLPGGGSVRVRDVQVHGEARPLALAGERTSLRLTGADSSEVRRGIQLATAGTLAATRSLLARFTLLPEAPRALGGSLPVRLHLYASEVVGRARPAGGQEIPPGGTGLVEIRLSAPVVAVRGDRLIARRLSPAATLGGGEVLDPAWSFPRGKALGPLLADVARGRREALFAWVRQAGEAGAGAADLARRLGERPERVAADLAAWAEEGLLLAAGPGPGRPPRWLVPAAYREVAERARAVLARAFAADRLSVGMPKAEAVERIFPGRAGELAEVYLAWLVAEKRLVVEAGRVDLPGRSAGLTGEESALSVAVLARFEAAGLASPSPGEVAASLGAKPQIFEGVLRYLAEQGKLIRLPGGLLVAASALERLRADLAATGWGRFSVAQFKDRFGLSRKWAIPLLEHLDSMGATRRAGDERLVVR
jgi:selenocysteine-specific elongation factor